MLKPSIALLVLIGIAGIMWGCSTPRGCYEDGYEIAVQFEQPDADDLEDAMEELEDAILIAREWLQDYPDQRTPSRHDQTAYIIPMARLAQARLHGRFNQITQQEDACWSAVREAERYLGAHIRSFSNSGSGPPLPFASYSVFFRREKIRRHAFLLLTETYREAGEKDLEALMQAQIGFSEIYLHSPASHKEEEYIRTIENSDWVRIYNADKEDIAYGFQVFFFSLAVAMAQAGAQMQRSQLESQMAMTQDPALRANLSSQIQSLDAQMERNMEQAMETYEQMEKAHQANLQAIENRFQNTVLGALMANFSMLKLSDAVKQLPAYQKLVTKKEAFDNYVERVGFDREAARALAEVRTSLDNLTITLQNRRKQGG